MIQAVIYFTEAGDGSGVEVDIQAGDHADFPATPLEGTYCDAAIAGLRAAMDQLAAKNGMATLAKSSGEWAEKHESLMEGGGQ